MLFFCLPGLVSGVSLWWNAVVRCGPCGWGAGEMDGCWLCLCDKRDCWFLLAPRDSCGSGDLSEVDGFWIESECGRSTK